MPPIGLLMGKVDFSSLFLNLSSTPQPSLAAAKAAGTPTINYGVFLQTVFDFIIIAFVIFMLVKQINRLKKPTAPAAATTKDCPLCLSTIPLKATKCAHCTSSV
jgi:large conductance mechanosensitive channel